MRQYRWIFSACFVLIFLSCNAEQGNYTAVSREGEYLYGVWNTHTEKAAKKLIDRIVQAGVKENPQIASLPIKTSLKTIDLLPVDGAIADWVRSREPSGYTAANLYKDTLGGHPELYRAYGVIEQAEVEYQTPRLASQPLILVEVFDMGSPENAFGIYSFNQYPQAEFEWVGNRAIISGNHLRFWKGKYFVQIEGYEFATKIKEGMIELAKTVAGRIKDRPEKPQLLRLLPEDKIPNSIKYFSGDAALRKIYSFLPEEGLQLGANTTGISASYLHKKNGSKDWTDATVVFLIRYPGESEATAAYDAYRSYLEENTVAVNPLEGEGVVVKEQ